MLENGKYFVTGIGTDVGKSIATGWLATEIMKEGRSVITQKFIQTGNKSMSEDIEMHRRIMGCGLLPEDIERITAPLILSYPASPDLAARIDNVEIDFEMPARMAEELSSSHDVLLIEGAGGIMVPLRKHYLTIDWLREHKMPAIVVTNGQLGSINHTLLTLEALRNAVIDISMVVYNPYFDKDEIICEDTRKYLRDWLSAFMPTTNFVEMPVVKLSESC